jgi:hypothetical protein
MSKVFPDNIITTFTQSDLHGKEGTILFTEHHEPTYSIHQIWFKDKRGTLYLLMEEHKEIE